MCDECVSRLVAAIIDTAIPIIIRINYIKYYYYNSSLHF
jgi:hypothetical protein